MDFLRRAGTVGVRCSGHPDALAGREEEVHRRTRCPNHGCAAVAHSGGYREEGLATFCRWRRMRRGSTNRLRQAVEGVQELQICLAGTGLSGHLCSNRHAPAIGLAGQAVLRELLQPLRWHSCCTHWVRGAQARLHHCGGRNPCGSRPADGSDEKKLGGIAEMTNFEVRNAPILARLLSLMSLDGLAKGAVSDGIQFTRLESRFDWLYRPEGSVLTVADGRTSGTAIGLTFDGTFDQATEELDLKGTIIPVSEVNKIIKSIPVLGEILTGGSGVIAATYTVKGPAEDPDLSMNPLSVLAPGFLRKILFE